MITFYIMPLILHLGLQKLKYLLSGPSRKSLLISAKEDKLSKTKINVDENDGEKKNRRMKCCVYQKEKQGFSDRETLDMLAYLSS